MDLFVLLLFALAAVSSVFSIMGFTSYPLVSVQLAAKNPLTAKTVLESTINWDPFRHRGDGTGGSVSALVVQGTDVGLSPLPSVFLRSAAAACIDDDTLFGTFTFAVSIAALHTIVTLVLAWSTPSGGDIQSMKRKLAKFVADAVAANNDAEDSDDEGVLPRLKFTQRADTKFAVSRVSSYGSVATCTILLAAACTTCVLGFVARTCVEEEMITSFRVASQRTRFVFSATSTSWPAFLMCFTSVTSFCSLLAMVQWLGLQQCGPKMFADAAEVEAEGLANDSSAAATALLMGTDRSHVAPVQHADRRPPPAVLHREQYATRLNL